MRAAKWFTNSGFSGMFFQAPVVQNVSHFASPMGTNVSAVRIVKLTSGASMPRNRVLKLSAVLWPTVSPSWTSCFGLPWTLLRMPNLKWPILNTPFTSSAFVGLNGFFAIFNCSVLNRWCASSAWSGTGAQVFVDRYCRAQRQCSQCQRRVGRRAGHRFHLVFELRAGP